MLDLGLIVLEGDSVSAATIQIQTLLPPEVTVHVARAKMPPSSDDEKAIAQFDRSISAAAASILPSARPAVICLACTTGALQLGKARLATAIDKGARGSVCIDPIHSAFDAVRAVGISRLAILSPYNALLSTLVAVAFVDERFDVDQLCYFGAPDEAITAISTGSIMQSAIAALSAGADGLFVSCTGMRSTGLIDALEARTGAPVLSSVQVLAWKAAATLGGAAMGPGVLLRSGTSAGGP